MSFRSYPLFRICKNCGDHFVSDGGTLNRNRKSFLKYPKCGSDSIVDEEKQKEYDEEEEKYLEEMRKKWEGRRKRLKII